MSKKPTANKNTGQSLKGKAKGLMGSTESFERLSDLGPIIPDPIPYEDYFFTGADS